MESFNIPQLPTRVDHTGSFSGPSSAKNGPSSPSTVAFKDLLYQQLQDVNGQYAQAQQGIDNLLSGNLDNIHNVVLDTAKAELSMQMMLEMRNRLTEQYQELMRMQI
jgi:flagellar hook-basal body complex protein FliE